MVLQFTFDDQHDRLEAAVRMPVGADGSVISVLS
jgi:hypothetical protein